MNIGIDIDGPVYPWHYSLYRHFCEEKGFVGTQAEFWKHFDTFDIDKQIYYVSLPFLYSDTSIRKDAKEALPLLAELGTIFYLTSRDDSLDRITEKFFYENNLPFKENLIYSEDKANHIKLNKIEFFVDDLPHNIDSTKMFTNAFLFEAIHNKDQREGYDTVSSLMEFYKKIKEKKIMKELGYGSLSFKRATGVSTATSTTPEEFMKET